VLLETQRSRGSLDQEVIYKLPQKKPFIYTDKIQPYKPICPIYTKQEHRSRKTKLKSQHGCRPSTAMIGGRRNPLGATQVSKQSGDRNGVAPASARGYDEYHRLTALKLTQ